MAITFDTDDEIVEAAKRILRRSVRRNTKLDSPAAVANYFAMKLQGLSYEVFCVVFLDSQHRIMGFKEMFYGTIDGAAVYPRRIVEESLNQGAAAVVMVHNHPSGVAEPSQADKRITERIQAALALVDVRMLDHFVVSGGDYHSFAENGLL